jgi:predicted ATP-dependent endonuclease of OLD family
MGAAAMSFTPTRHALIAEGAADAILLPTLLRQASDEERLGFQVAPGLSSVASSSVAELEAEAGRVAFLVDGDKGGSNIVAKLTGAGIPANRVMTLTDSTTGEGLEVEDLVAPSVYAQAANDELRCWQEIDTEMTVDDFGAALRTKAVEAWCASQGVEAPDKAAVAQRVVDASTDESIVAASRQDVLRSLLAETRSALGLP